MTKPTEAVETFLIPRRPGWGAGVEVQITCDPAAPHTIKLGLAVRVAFRSRADLWGADLWGADLSGANLSGANLSEANLSEANLSEANLSEAYLSGANLSEANLSEANLSEANLSEAYLSGANLSGANLSEADLSGANLSGAYLSGANLSEAYLHGEKITRIFASASRSDGHTFYGAQLVDGGYKIAAGCRWFTDVEYRAHVAAGGDRDNYPVEETTAILDFVAERARQVGVVAPVLEAAQ